VKKKILVGDSDMDASNFFRTETDLAVNEVSSSGAQLRRVTERLGDRLVRRKHPASKITAHR
jgi:hypothetical protein